MKVGLFGGSFNPIHNDHIKIVKYTLEKRFSDEVWALPCKIHAFGKQLAYEKDRIEMINLALKGIDNAKVCDIELKSEGKSYTVDTIRKLKAKYNHKFYFMIGYDILKEIHRWRNHRQLFNETEFIAFKRKDYCFEKIPGMNIAHMVDWKGNYNLSSSLIREKIGQNKSIKNLVPSSVEEYIRNNRLYRPKKLESF